MDTTTLIMALVGMALLGLLATIVIIHRSGAASRAAAADRPFAVSTEGMTRCPSCGTGNLVADVTCSGCGKRLP